MKFKTLILAVLFVCFAAGSVFAAADNFSLAKKKEVSVSLQAISPEDADTTLTFTGRFGYNLTNWLGLGVSYVQTGSGDVSTYGPGIDGTVFWIVQPLLVPYGKVALGYSAIDGDGFDDSGITAALGLGVKSFISESTAVFIEYQNIMIDYKDAGSTHMGITTLGFTYVF